MSERAAIGIIGGTGLYQMEGFTDVREVAVETPFGPPSDALMLGQLEGRAVAFLPRHGRGHRILPHELNFQANVFAMKSLGVEFLLSVSAVGSLKEAYAPLDMLVPDQLDRPHAAAPLDLLRPRARGPRGVRAPLLPRAVEADGRGLPGSRGQAPRGRDLRVHRGPAVLDLRRVAALPLVGRGRGRHDQPAGGQARARGGDLLRDARDGDRLRLLAPRARRGHGRERDEGAGAERRDGACGAAGGRAAAAGPARVRVRARAAPRAADAAASWCPRP